MPDASRRGRARQVLGVVSALVLGAAGALATMSLVPTPEQRVGPATVQVAAEPGRGETVLRIPPFGAVSARTHGAPLRLTATLTALDPQGIARGLVTETSRAELVGAMAAGLRRAAVTVGIRLLLAGLIVGGLVAGLLPGRHLRGVLVGGAGGLAAISLLLLATGRGYDVGAFAEPHFTGTLEHAPQVLQAMEKQGASIEALRSKFQVAAGRLAEVVALAATPSPNPRSGTVAILHVSDIHSNPLGVEFAKQLAERFDVDAILDTGDLTSFGQPIETRIGELLSAIGRPWLFVPGNHDSPEVRSSLGGVPNVVVLDQRTATVEGVTILGWGDPTFTPGTLMTTAESRRRQLAEASAVAGRVEETSPDVLAVHNADLAAESVGLVPLVLSGHGHVRKKRTMRATLELEVGSTGATGLGSFLVQADLAYEAEILYFRDRRAVAVDYIRFRTLGSDFEIERTTLDREPLAPAGSPSSGSPSPSPSGSAG